MDPVLIGTLPDTTAIVSSCREIKAFQGLYPNELPNANNLLYLNRSDLQYFLLPPIQIISFKQMFSDSLNKAGQKQNRPCNWFIADCYLQLSPYTYWLVCNANQEL